MGKEQEQLNALRDIRSMMERSSRFISLSGLSGVIAGLAAIGGTITACSYLGISLTDPGSFKPADYITGNPDSYKFLMADFLIVLMIAILSAVLLSGRKAKRAGLPAWDATAKRLLINLFVPLATGGIFCLILFYHEFVVLILPATLIFYGMALLNASKYTLNDIRYLGVIEIICGLVAGFALDYALLLWAFGFGVLHIVYGVSMYLKYER